MGFKCTPQIAGLVRGEPKQGAKHRVNGAKILAEMGKERRSKSVTLDRARSVLNKYEGYEAGLDCWSDMEKEASEYRSSVRLRDGSIAERGLRSDAVIGWSIIINPPAEMTIGWTADEYERFFIDSFNTMIDIEPRLFCLDNMRMTAIHRDEGRKEASDEFSYHMHIAGVSKDEDGRYCGNVLDARLCCRINQEYPAAMRRLGWQLDDLDCTDWKRMGKDENGEYVDPEYRVRRMKKKAGRSVNEYCDDVKAEADEKARQTVEAAQEAAEAVLSGAKARSHESYRRLRKPGKRP